MLLYWVFFFKQKTAYEMRISDWSSDVCSSDLIARSLSPRPLIGFDDPPDDRVADDVGAGEAADVDPLQPFETRDGVGEARGRGDRQVDLLGVAADDHAAVHAKAGQEHLHLRNRRVLRLVENDEGVGERAAAHERPDRTSTRLKSSH